MHLLVPLLLLAGIIAVVGAVVRDAQRQHRRAQRTEEELIANPPQLPPNGEWVFRKPKFAGYVLILLFVFIVCLATSAFAIRYGSLRASFVMHATFNGIACVASVLTQG
jgi:pheromone shutdown protein TraB